jgi:ATP-dependent helicase/nuclease subunit B
MPTPTTIITGPAASGKTTLALAEYSARITAARPGRALWIAPSGRAAALVRGQLLQDSPRAAVLGPGVHTFASLAAAVVQASRQPVRRIGPLEKRVLVGRLIDDARRSGRLRHFHAVADTGGFVELMLQFIAEWKRLEIWPDDFRAAAETRGRTAKDAELAMLYESYQLTLTERKWFDAEGLIWLARAQLRDGQQAPFPELEILVADGFSDFTRTEHEILELLAQRSEWSLITLPDEAGDERSDLFAKARRTAAQIRSRHPGCHSKQLPPRASGDWPAMEHLERRVFGHPRQAVQAVETKRIEILAAGRELGELELIATRVKSLLIEGDPDDGRAIAPGDVAIVYRSIDAFAPLVREAFARYGIPYYLEQAESISATPLVSALLQLARLHAEDWPHRTLLGVLNQSFFRPTFPDWNTRTAVAVELAVRESQLPRGREALLNRCERALLHAPAAQRESFAASHRILAALSDVLKQLPGRAPAPDWLAQLESVARALGYLDDITVADASSWRQLQEAAALLAQMNHELGDEAKLDAAEFVRWLGDVAAATPAMQPTDDVGRVRILAAASVRALEIPYLFVAGLSEKAFPAAAGEGRVYGEAECRQLCDAGLPLVLRAERAEEEMLLFYETFTRARRRLYLSYPAIDARAQPLSPSPYFTEVERAMGGAKLQRHVTENLSPLPAHGAAWNERDWRVGAVVAAASGEVGSLEALALQPALASMSRNVLGGLNVVRSRSTREVFGPFEGMLESMCVQRDCAARFGPQRVWSATELEQYGECPFRFFMERVLNLAPLPEPELKADHLSRGARMHSVLAALHRYVNVMHAPGAHPQILDPDSYAELIDRLLLESIAAEGPDDVSLAGALDDLQRRELREWLVGYREQHQHYAGASGLTTTMQPLHFEAAFGMRRERRDDEPARDDISVDECLELRRGEDAIRIAGRVDRVDVADVDGRLVFNVLDYKTGKHPKKHAIESAAALQLPLYALAVERLLLAPQGAIPWQIGYWSVADKGYAGQLQLGTQASAGIATTEVWRQLVETIESHVFALVRGLRRAEFPMHNTDKHCTAWCDFHTTCRVNQVRALEKTWQPPAETPSV